MKKALQEAIDAAETVSFDLFDTLLGRRCALPEDVFLWLEEIHCGRHGKAFLNFARERREADREARREPWESRQAMEIGLEDIYRWLASRHPEWPVSPDDLMAAELECERRVLYPLARGREILQYAAGVGKEIIYISDMYLPRPFCDDILSTYQLDQYDYFFLSSEVGQLKSSGRLFRHVLQNLERKPETILHLGDNPHSDVKMARENGLRAWRVEKASEVPARFERNPWITKSGKSDFRQSVLRGISIAGNFRESLKKDPFWFRIGYQVAGPIIRGYLQFIIESLSRREVSRLFFLSRDGYIMKQVYDVMVTDRGDCPESDYLYASRRALNFAAITQLDEKTENWLAEGIRLTVGDFFQRIHLRPGDHAEALRKAGFTSAEDAVSGGKDYRKLRQLYHLVEPAILKAAEEERSLYLEYLNSHDVTRENPFVLVDVGWMTSIQQSFSRLLHPVRPDLRIEGFFLGSYPEARHRAGPDSIHHHYLMAYGEPASTMETIRYSVALLEFFFAAPEPTFLRMEREANGGLRPVFAEHHENEEDLPALARLHEGVLEYTRDFQAVDPESRISLKPEEGVRALRRLLAEPTREEAENLGSLRYADGYGAYFNHDYMANPSGWRKLGLNKKRWKEEFKHAHWRRGYYERLGGLDRIIFKLLHPEARFSKRHD